ncbi:MAG: ABC transporter ATP-binding protein [Alphaproteobacteria bacterium]
MNNKPFPKTAFKYLIYECLLPYKWQFLICIFLVAAESGVYNLLNWFFAGLIESLKSGTDEQTLKHVLYITAAIIGCDVINIFLPKITLMHRQKYLYFPLQEMLYGRTLSYIFGHSVNYIINKQTGTLLAKTNQVTGIQTTLSTIITALWSRVSDIVLKVGLLTIINVWLGVLFIICAVVVAIVNYYANKSSDRLSKMQGKSESLYTGWLVDTISNIRTVKQFNRLNYEKQRLSVLLKQYIRIKAKTMLVWFTSYTGVGCFVHVCSLSVLTFAVYLWSVAKINIGDIVFVLLTLNGGFMWLMELCVLYRRFENGLSYIQAGLEPFYTAHEIQNVANATELKIKKADIEFKNICFAYPNGQQIFTDFNLKIKAGERLGIVGLSGNGKTTLINLLQRAYDIQSGQILIDGQDIKTVTQQSLHQNIAIIPQEAVLFHRSIRDNIAYGNSDASERKIKQAATIACADEFIKTLPQKYDTIVGDRGCTLSGGERQRIAIARAVLRNNPILILDEATSSLDSEAEQKVAQAINNLLGKRTVLAIAHRLSTLKEMDRIIYIENGKIIEEGTFTELSTKTGGKFAKLWQLQQIEEEK